MPASLKWIDYDSGAHQRAQRILRLFSERETRDELGLGSVRDAIADWLFPGTSVIHTRLRYMLFVPWIYMDLERRATTTARVGDRAREVELELIDCLLNNCPDDQGIIGRDARKSLKTLPSAIYWAGMGALGLRLYPGTQSQYHRALDLIYGRRRSLRQRRTAATEEGDDVGGLWDVGAYTWHPGIPEPSRNFPRDADFVLAREEARFLQERIRQRHPRSLLAHLAIQPRRTEFAEPWTHPDLADFTEAHRTMLFHGHNFSVTAYGAALLYNLMLAEDRRDEALVQQYNEEIEEWAKKLKARLDELRGWAGRIDQFWADITAQGHVVGARTRAFVESWLSLALEGREGVFENAAARHLVRSREIEKKRGNSRFTNPRMLEQWSGRSGLVPMRYRWQIVQSYIGDLAAALTQR